MPVRVSRRRLPAILITLALLAASGGPAGTAAQQPAVDDQTLRAIAFREQFGLPADLAYVQSVAADSRSSASEWGVPLTLAERDDLARRVTIQEDLDGLLAVAATQPTVFGGLRIDQQAGGQVEILLTANTEENQRIFRSVVPSGASVRFREVAHSQAELDGVHEAVLRDRAILGKLGLDFISVSTNVVDNMVDVGVGNAGRWVQELLEERYGAGLVRAVPAVRPSTSACNTRENCANPLKGGLTIVGPNGVCTSSFIGKTAGGNYLMYTAGHCGDFGKSFTHNGVGIGNVTAEKYQDNSSADAGVIDIPNAQKSNLVMGAEGPAYGYTSITSKKALGVVVGTGLCKSGSTSDFDCGVVTDNDVDGEYDDGTLILNQIEMDIQCRLGDSGGPVWINSKAYGILSACYYYNNVPLDYGLYTQIAAAEAVLAVPIYFGN